MGADNQAEVAIAKIEFRRIMRHILLRPSLDWEERMQQYTGTSRLRTKEYQQCR